MQQPSAPKTPRHETFQQLCSSLKLASRLPDKRSESNKSDHFDRLVGNLRQKRLIDCLGTSLGSGAGLLGMFLCQQASEQSGELVVIDTQGTFFPPVAIAWGIEANRLLVVRPKTDREGIAATELALRSPAVSAVWATLERLDPKASRRLLLAAESARALGVLIRSARYQSDPSWADVQLRCEPVPTKEQKQDQRLMRVTQTRNRHGPLTGSAVVAMNWRTGSIQAEIENHESDNFSAHPLSLAARLARATFSAGEP